MLCISWNTPGFVCMRYSIWGPRPCRRRPRGVACRGKVRPPPRSAARRRRCTCTTIPPAATRTTSSRLLIQTRGSGKFYQKHCSLLLLSLVLTCINTTSFRRLVLGCTEVDLCDQITICCWVCSQFAGSLTFYTRFAPFQPKKISEICPLQSMLVSSMFLFFAISCQTPTFLHWCWWRCFGMIWVFEKHSDSKRCACIIREKNVSLSLSG